MPTFTQAHAQLTHPLVRALAWCIGSPNVFNPAAPIWAGALHDDVFGEAAFETLWPQLQTLEKNPAPLARWMGWPEAAFSKKPLGKTFEQLIGYWLSHREDIAIVQPSLIAKQFGRVVGEFDFIYADHAHALHALELTVKFYLRIDPTRGAAGYVGPMVYDFMADKVSRMATHQVGLAKTDAGQTALAAWCRRTRVPFDETHALPVTARALSRGILFSHYASPATPEPIEVSPARLTGTWARVSEIARIDGATQAQWKALDGIEWLGTQRTDARALTTLAACASTIGKERHAMVAQFGAADANGVATESHRWMILGETARVFELLKTPNES